MYPYILAYIFFDIKYDDNPATNANILSASDGEKNIAFNIPDEIEPDTISNLLIMGLVAAAPNADKGAPSIPKNIVATISEDVPDIIAVSIYT